MSEVDIIIPIYNSGKKLKYTLDSVLNQTFVDFSLYLVVDPSKDDSLQICESYGDQDERICIVKNEFRRGMGESRDIGYRMGDAKWVSFLDSDDLISPDYLEILLELSNDEIDIVQSRVMNISETDIKIESRILDDSGENLYFDGKESFTDLFLYDRGIHGQQVTWGKIIRRSCIERFIDILREKKEKMGMTYLDDFSFSPMLWYYSRGNVISRMAMYGFRIHSSSTSNREWFNEHYLQQINAMEYRLEFLNNIGEEDVLRRQTMNCFSMLAYFLTRAKQCNNASLYDKTMKRIFAFIDMNSKYISIKSIKNPHTLLVYINTILFCFSPQIWLVLFGGFIERYEKSNEIRV